MRTFQTSVICLLLWTVAAAATPLPIETQRVAAPAQILHAGKKVTLLPRRQLETGDRISTGRNGRVVLQLENAGELILGDQAELYVHSAEPSGDNYGALARMALMRGSLRMDSTARVDQPPQDMRLNVGTLRLRVLGAEVWADVEPGVSQTVCLLQGSVEIVSDSGNEHLDRPGDCFRYSANNVRMRLRPDTDDTLARKLTRTALSDERPPGTPPVTIAAPLPHPSRPQPLTGAAATPVATAAPSPAASVGVTAAPPVAAIPAPPPAAAAPQEPPAAAPAPAPLAVAEPEMAPALPPAIEPAAPVAAAQETGEWTVIVASVKNAEAAEKEALRLSTSRGLAAQVRLSNTGFYRVCIGTFGSRELARAYAAELRSREKLQAWITSIN